MEGFGVFWWSTIRRDKLESRSVHGLTSLLYVPVSEVAQSHDQGPGRNPERYLRFESQVTPSKDLCKQFQRRLNVSRLETNHGGQIVHTLAEVHPQRLSSEYEERMDNGPGSVPIYQGLLFLGSKANSQFVQSAYNP